MSSIHYKFKATLEYKTLVFDGLHISVNDLKKEICEKENIKAESFDLLLANAHTKKQYTNDELIPRNSSIIVQRSPRDNAVKLPKVQDTSNSGIVNKATASEPIFTGQIESEKFDKMTEEERLAHVKEVSSYKYQPANFQRRTSSIMSGPPPPTYQCNRCYQSGHWYKNCPMLNTRRTTGITMDELMETTPDDPNAMLHPSGKYVVPVLHWKARQQKKPETAAPSPGLEERTIPPELKCPLCNHLLRDAVLTTCCGDSFCAECVTQRLLESNSKCPGSNCIQTSVSADQLVPNLKVRQAVEAFKNASASSSSTSSLQPRPAAQPSGAGSPYSGSGDSPYRADPQYQLQPAQPVMRVRIGLNPQIQTSQSSVPLQQQILHPQIQPTTVTTSASGAENTSNIVTTTAPLTTIPATIIQQPTIVTQLPRPSQPAPTQAIVNPVVSSNIVPPTNPHVVLQPSTVTTTPVSLNLSQPPPGYGHITPASGLMNIALARPPPTIVVPVSATALGVLPSMSAPPPLIASNVQPPPPGLTPANVFPTPRAPPPIKDAWDEFLERKEKSRQRAMSRRHHSSRSSSSSSSETESSSSSDSRDHSRSRDRSWSRERDRRERHRNSSRDDRSRRRSDRSSRSPPRGPPYSSRYPRELPPTFGLYSHPPPSMSSSNASAFVPGRVPPLMSTYQPPPFIPPNINSANNFTPLPNIANGPYGYRPNKFHIDERNMRRRSPRYPKPDKRPVRRGESKENENEQRKGKSKNERESRKRTHEDESKERAVPEEKSVRSNVHADGAKDIKKHKEKENVVKESEEAQVDIEIQEMNRQLEGAAEAENAEGISLTDELIEREDSNGESEGEQMEVDGQKVMKEDDGMTVKEEMSEAVLLKEKEESISGAEAENEDDVEIEDDKKDEGEKSEKRRHKKKQKKHRRESRDAEGKERHRGHKKHEDSESRERRKHGKKHKKRSKEDKEKRRMEKEKRREERRRRRKEREEAENEKEIVDKEDDKMGMETEKEKVVEKIVAPTVEPSRKVGRGDENVKDSEQKTLSQICDENRRATTDKNEGIAEDEKKIKKPSESEKKRRHSTEEKKDEKQREDDKKEKEKRKRSEDGRGKDDRKSKGEETKKKEEHKKSEPSEDGMKQRGRHDSRGDRKRDESKEISKSGKSEKNDAKQSNDKERAKESETSRDDKSKRWKSECHDRSDTDKRRENRESDHKGKALHSSKSTKGVEKSVKERESRREERPRRDGLKDKQLKEEETRKEMEESDIVKKESELQRQSRKEKEEVEKRRLNEIKTTIEKELAAGRKTEKLTEKLNKTSTIDTPRTEKPNLTVEVKSGGEKKVTRETIFENSIPQFNARQKIKMILLSESERSAADRAKMRKGSK
ncbi:hypothetical protein AB6A40_001500 [Gnathostoma spinigerum]|uniref:E3 ubiquitin-protein ligase RBBP6 n=1 Tax=Gnathostoma spinigerum TaxID=75299 RepID=A0ABD6E6K8_9BILA